jgi:PAS domain S-box-containing protein
MGLSGRGVDQEVVDLILANVADGVFAVDQDFRITFFNRAAEEITGFSAEQAVGQRCCDIFRTPICSEDCPLREAVEGGRKVRNVEVEILTSKEKWQTVSVSTAPLIGKGGEFLGGVETFRDITPLKQLRRELSARFTFGDIVSRNPRMRQIIETLPNVARSSAAVLLQGHRGSGKELVARALHTTSSRSAGPFVKVHCGASVPELLDIELFGQPVDESAPGALEGAHGGTLYLEDAGEIPLALQSKLTRALEERAIVGADGRRRTIDVRIVAATNFKLQGLVAEGRFREDLYYQLSVIVVHLPDLGERREDIPLLVQHLLERFNNRMGKKIQGVTDKAMRILMRYPFPGNVRELENALEHAYVVARRSRIGEDDLPPHIGSQSRSLSWRAAARARTGALTADSERQRLAECLERHHWNIPSAAQELGVHRTTLWRRVKRMKLRRS